MANNLPIYTSLIKECDDKDLTGVQKATLVKKIQGLNEDGMERVYAIIMVYFIENEPNVGSGIPYNSKIEGTNISFNLEFIPNRLKQILNKFVTIHSKVMSETG